MYWALFWFLSQKYVRRQMPGVRVLHPIRFYIYMDTHIFIKAVTGVFVIPIAVSAHKAWPWWTQTRMPVRIASGVVVLPLVGLASILTPWWDSF